MEHKARLKLSPLEGDGECFLEIGFDENGDAFVGMRGQDIKGKTYEIKAQVPSPLNGGGNSENYSALIHVYRVMKKNENKSKSKT